MLSCFNCQTNENLINITEFDSNEVEWKSKLIYCLPELDWNITCCLCRMCGDQLDVVCGFRNQCVSSYMRLNLSELSLKACIKCDSSFENENLLEKHVLLQHVSANEWEHNCLQCDLKYPTVESLNAHLEIQHEDLKKCFHCGEGYTEKSALAEHIQKEHAAKEEVTPKKRGRKPKEKTISQCDLCQMIFSTKYLLNRHVRNVHATKKNYNCELCGHKFASPVYLAAHKKYHSGNRPHICTYCGKGYITASDLYHHEKIHLNKRAYKCDKCPKAFNTSSDLHKHRICVHMDRALWKYVCSYCNRRFPLKTNLDTHTKTHTGEKNYACHLCDRRCINRSVLQRHIESHSNVRSFKCTHCSQDYKYQKSLDVHLAKAHGVGDAKIPERVKKYFCHICPKSYFANNKLQKHIRSHTGERPFACDLCDKRFIDKSYVKQHLKTAHNVLLAM